MLTSQNQILEKAMNKLMYVSADEQLRYELDMLEKAELDYNSAMKTNFDKGKLEGELKGRLEAALSIVKGLRMPVSKAMEIVGLMPGEREKLISELEHRNISYEN